MTPSMMHQKTYRTKLVDQKKWAELGFSQEKIIGFNLSRYQKSKVLIIGAGAIGGHTAYGMVRKGIRYLDIMDDDSVELKNLTRQFFYLKNVGKNKAISLAKNLSKEGYFDSTICGYPYRFQEALEMGMDLSRYNAFICAVDNNPTRISVTEYCLSKFIPLIINGVARDGSQMYCAVQQPGKACFGCIMPLEINYSRYPCNLPGIIDIIQVVSGFTVYALDTILMGRHRDWNLRMLSLDGSMPESSLQILKNDNCSLCRKQ
jgi:molybdopterin/thiamine biosynthesis adenylyltransferase